MQKKPKRLATLVLVSSTARQRTDSQGDTARPPTPPPSLSVVPPDAGTDEDIDAVNARIQRVLGDSSKYEQAFTAFQNAVAAHDTKAVAALVAYPFTANVGSRKVKLSDASAFRRHYDAIVTLDIANVITRQRYADLFVNEDGVMFGQGEAWLNGVCRDAVGRDFDVRVIAIQSTR